MEERIMPYHEWGDNDFDWKSLYKAESIIYRVCKLFRLGCHIKEKYGSIRCSVYPFDGSLHSFLYPGYVAYQYEHWWLSKTLKRRFNFDLADKLVWLDIYVLGSYRSDEYNKSIFIRAYSRFVRIVQWLQMNIGYRLAYYIPMKLYPHIKDEIASQADCYEYIIGGKEIHDKYWRRV
jgi:hypothetical protein